MKFDDFKVAFCKVVGWFRFATVFGQFVVQNLNFHLDVRHKSGINQAKSRKKAQDNDAHLGAADNPN